MEVAKIREVRRRTPFQPYTLVLRDGKRLHVDFPTRLAISPMDNELAYATEEGPLFISPTIVESIEQGDLPERQSR
jgi:hypothetical protein